MTSSWKQFPNSIDRARSGIPAADLTSRTAMAEVKELVCRQCGAAPPTLQTFACARCGHPTPIADAKALEAEKAKEGS